MNKSYEQELADRLHRELKQLPGHRAPRTLAPRVLAAIAARQHAPWWKKSWSGWPLGMKLAFLVVGLAALSGLAVAAMAAPQLASLGAGTLASFDSLVAQFQPWLALAGRMTDSVSVALQAAGPHLMWYLAALVGVAYATCIGLGTVGYRLVANRI